jgi:hypothetical protein
MLAMLWLLGGSPAVGCSPGVVVTGASKEDPTWKGTQSETATTTARSGGKDTFIVTYNDDTDDGKIVYTTNDRVVFPGASQLGWSYSYDDGKTWTYGGKVKPPAGIAALWGDPAIVTSRTNYGRVYLTSLAVDASKIPAAGHHGWFDDGTITGACIARSDDGGIHFAIHSCVSAEGDFYDGSALAAGGSGDPRVFAAFRDVAKNRIDVYASADGIAPFTKIADPYPGMSIVSHPRLASDQTGGALLIAAIASDGLIHLNRLKGIAWQWPVVASHPITRIDINVGAQTIRMAYGFSFDVGASSWAEMPDGSIRDNQDGVRLLYTTRDAETKRLYVRGTSCRSDLGVSCRDVPQWGTTPGNLNTPRDQWNPMVTAWPGLLGLAPEWKATYQTTDDDPQKVSIKEGNLAVLPGTKYAPIFLPFDLVPPRPICPDFRYGSPGHATSGYWGDYDEMTFAGFTKDSTPRFLLAFSDSSQGCFSQSEFTSNHLHVSSVVFQ